MIRGIIFDYGGTLDTNGLHWSEVLWMGYRRAGVPVTKEQFRECYVFAERELAKHPHIKPEHNFLHLLRIKADIETGYLVAQGHWATDETSRRAASEAVAQYCYAYARRTTVACRPVLAALAERCPLVLVSNFYGNIRTVLRDFGLLRHFPHVVESAVVGVRKPDPRIFLLGVEALGIRAEETAVVGDSYRKDILPAHSIGCQTVWLKGKGWAEEQVDESLPTLTITDIASLPALLLRL